MVLKRILNVVEEVLVKLKNNNKESKYKNPPLYTEDEILKAMENLPVEATQPKGYSTKELTCKVIKPNTWSLFKYLNEMPDNTDSKDKSFFYAIPAGLEYDSEFKMWYIGVYLNDTVDNAFEFYTSYNYLKKQETSDV